MITLARIAIAAILALFTSSCAFDINFGQGKRGNGQIVQENREITNEFDAVHASEGLDVFVTQGSPFIIEVEADENIIDLIGTDIKDGRLKIHATENIGRATKNIYITLPQIRILKTSSGADLVVQNTIMADKIMLKASSGSDLEAQVNATEVIAESSSGADIHISGNTEVLYVDASSGSDIKAKRLSSVQCTANASSGADISVNVSESLTRTC